MANMMALALVGSALMLGVVDAQSGAQAIEVGTKHMKTRPELLRRESLVSIAAHSDAPTDAPNDAPTDAPTVAATDAPTDAPTVAAPDVSTDAPTDAPTVAAPDASSVAPTDASTDAPTVAATDAATQAPTDAPTSAATVAPTVGLIDDGSYASQVLADQPVAYFSMGHSAAVLAGDPQAGNVCEIGATSSPATQKALAQGEACGQPGGLDFGDACQIDAAICAPAASASIFAPAPALIGNASTFATRFTGGEYLMVPDDALVNTHHEGYAKRTVELWFKAASADAVKRMIFAEGSQHHAGLSMFVTQADNKVKLNMFAWDRGNHDNEFGSVETDRSIFPNPLSCEISLDQTYYTVMEFDGVARTFTGYLRKVNSAGEDPTVCGQYTQLPVGAKLSHHGHNFGNAVIGGIGVCRTPGTSCPSSRANGRADGGITRLATDSDTSTNFVGTIDEVAIYNDVLSMEAMRRHLKAGGDVSTGADVPAIGATSGVTPP